MNQLKNILSRRLFLKSSVALVSLGTTLKKLAAASETLPDEKSIKEKKIASGLTVESDRPLNMETPMHLLDDEVTPASKLFVRNNGKIPEIAFSKNIQDYTLKIDGCVLNPLTLTLDDLKKKYKPVTYHFVLECGGNGRKGFYPETVGNQWGYGAVGCPTWTGVPLYQLLEEAKLNEKAFYLAYYGLDAHLNGNTAVYPISRGVPLKKALDPMTLVAYAMNGEDIPAEHGFPVRLVCPGYPASVSGKWLARLEVKDKLHDGPKMEAPNYMMPKYPIRQGQQIPLEDFDIIEEMPTKSLITYPPSYKEFAKNAEIEIRGWAWTAHKEIKDVQISIDFGASWIPTTLKPAKNRYGWQRYTTALKGLKPGYYEVMAKATSSEGQSQPVLVPNWNPRGYLNNACPRICFKVLVLLFLFVMGFGGIGVTSYLHAEASHKTPVDENPMGYLPALGSEEGRKLVAGYCGVCHSLMLVSKQRLDKENWLKTIRWMQKTQGLWPIPKPQEDEILNYLTLAFGPSDQGLAGFKGKYMLQGDMGDGLGPLLINPLK